MKRLLILLICILTALDVSAQTYLYKACKYNITFYDSKTNTYQRGNLIDTDIDITVYGSTNQVFIDSLSPQLFNLRSPISLPIFPTSYGYEKTYKAIDIDNGNCEVSFVRDDYGGYWIQITYDNAILSYRILL